MKHECRMHALLLCAVLFLLAAPLYAQRIPFYNSSDLLKNGLEAYEQGDYKKAQEWYGKVPEGDTNYLMALYERSLTCLADSSYKECIDLAGKALKEGFEDRRELLLNIGTAYDYLDDQPQAFRFYDSVAALYPHDHRPFFEKGAAYFRDKEYDKAEVLFRQALLRNPYHFRSHLLLGTIYAMEGRLTEAFIATQASLLCTNDRNVAEKSIGMLNALAHQTDEITDFYSNKKPEYANPDYDEIDEIVHAKLALDKGYQLQTEINDNIVRQLQVILEKLSYNSKDTGFVMQYYVPVLKKVYDQHQFESYVLLLFSEYDIEAVDKIAARRKGKAQLEEVRNLVFPYLNHIQATRLLPYEARLKAEERYHYFPKEQLMAAGKLADPEKHTYSGFVQWYREQALAAEGNYNNAGKKTGVWKYYYPNGKPRMTEEYNNGDPSGEWTSWHRNGTMSDRAKFNAEGKATERYGYTDNGRLESKGILKANDDYQITYYHPDGSVWRTVMVNDEKMKDGNYTTLFSNGKVEKEMTIRNGKLNGPFRSYYESGALKETYDCKEDMIDGLYQSFYEHGKPKEKYSYADGTRDGAAETYYDSGQIFSRQSFKKGKMDGTITYYDRNGKAYGVLIYNKDLIVSAQYTGPDGKVIYSKAASEGVGQLDVFNEYGIRRTSLFQDGQGNVQGKKTYYYSSGVIKEETEYKDDKEEGSSVAYYKNGKTESKRQYKAGQTDGYYQGYGTNGVLKSEGWLKESTSQGVWHNYGENGKLQRDFFMLDGELNGPEKNYEQDGKLDYIRIFDKGMITGLIQYDTTGKIIQDVCFPQGNGIYKTIYANGKPGLQCQLKYGSFEGPYTVHSAGGKLQEQGTYSCGYKQGETIAYYPNGNVRFKGSYKKSEKNGLWLFYREDGKIESETWYRNDEQDGPDKFYAGDMLRYETLYHEGNKLQSTIYGEEGKRAAVLYYNDGFLTGYSWEGKDGKLLPATPVHNGTADISTTYANGAKALDFHFIKNCYEGDQKLYYSNGQLAEDRLFAGDDFNGVYSRFYPDGSKMHEASFKNDTQQGIENKYDKNGRLIFTATFLDGMPHGTAQIIDHEGKGMVGLQYYYGTLQ